MAKQIGLADWLKEGPRGRVLAEDKFANGPGGWVQLIASQYPTGVVMFDGEYGYGDGCGSLLLEAADGRHGTNDVHHGASAVKRLWRGSSQHIDGYVDMQWVWYYGSQYDQNSPRQVQFGLDCASPTATPRRFFQVRWLNYDVVGGTRVTKYQVNVGSSDAPNWVDIPTASWQSSAGTGDVTGSSYPHGWNENKRDWHMLRARFDVQTGKYLGIMIDGDPHGIYTDAPSDLTAWEALGSPTAESLPTFEGGFNAWFSIENKTNSPVNTHSWAGLGYFRAETGWEL